MDEIQNGKPHSAYVWHLFLVLCVISGIAADPAYAEEPKPRWTTAIQGSTDVASIETTRDTLLVLGDSGGHAGNQAHRDITALDRQDGHLLWRIEGTYSDRTEGTVRTLDEQTFTLVGVTSPKIRPQVVVLLSFASHYVAGESGNEMGKQTWMAELCGLELRTGHRLWRSPLELNSNTLASEQFDHLIWYPLGVYGQTIILHRSGSRARLRFQNARTGGALAPNRPQDLAVLRRSAALFGERYGNWDDSTQAGITAISPKTSRPFSIVPLCSYGGGSGRLLGSVGDTRVYFVVTDDGMTGHSNWPNYVYCYNVRGKRLWQFPRNVRDEDARSKQGHGAQLSMGAVNPRCRNVVVLDHDGYLYALDANTGKPIRKRTREFSESETWVPYAQGYVTYKWIPRDRKGNLIPNKAAFSYICGRALTSKKTTLLNVSSSTKLLQAGRDFLFVLSDGGRTRIVCFPGETLVGSFAK